MLALLGLVAALVAGCGSGSPPRERIGGYFAALNAAADRGPAAQTTFLRRTQHPGFADRFCSNPDTTFTERPTLSTLHRDPRWAPRGAAHPSGTVYVVAVLLTAKRGGAPASTQISLARVADLHGRIYGFAPCARM